MSWFILDLMMCISLVVAIPVSQLRVVPKKGSKLLLHVMCWSAVGLSSVD